VEAATCAEIVDAGTEVAALIPEIKTAEIKRLKPEINKLQKKQVIEMQRQSERLKEKISREWQTQSSEIKKSMEEMQQQLHKEEMEWQRQAKKWKVDSEI
jgi:gas vesicle protein